ncbi:MAG: hypothetical protein K6G00_07430 [Treponema sp.]|nr:hypothetical protein [Treponema sp.]
MNFNELKSRISFINYNSQTDSNVTYCFVYKEFISRLKGKSDILYIGKTEQPIKKRYFQETNTQFSEKNSQRTNIRTTYIYEKLGLENFSCFYTKSLTIKLSAEELKLFLENLKAFDIQYRNLILKKETNEVDLEKYLLVSYGAEHLELPPLNNRF